MLKRITALFICLILSAFFVTSIAFASQLHLPTNNYVNDFAGVLNNDTVQKAGVIGRELDSKTGAQVVVAIVKTLDGGSVEEYATALFRKWGIGQKDKNNGVLLLIAINDRKVKD